MKIISLGWGVQSFTLAAMVALGKLESVDYAVHADTSYESSLTYAFAEKWTLWLEERGLKVITLKRDNPIINHYGGVEIPAYTPGGAPADRQCTTDWKVMPVRRFVSSELKRLGLTKTEGVIEQWIGISTDEWCRSKTSDVKYIKNRYPLLELGMSRKDCEKFLLDNGLEVPTKSSCVFCPFHRKADWQLVKAIDGDWQKAVEVDRLVRNVPNQPTLWVHSSRVPLEEVDLRTPEEMGQMHLSESCSECWL